MFDEKKEGNVCMLWSMKEAFYRRSMEINSMEINVIVNTCFRIV